MNVALMRNMLVLALVFAPSVWAETSLSDTRSSLEKWIEARQLVSKATGDWQTDKETIEQSIQLFARELKSVEDQISKVSTNSTQVDKERAQAEALSKSSTEILDRTRELAAGFEGRLTKLVPRLPAPLQEILKPLLNRIPKDPSTRTTAAERLQTLVGVLNELDKFNNAVSVFSEKRKNAKGEDVAVESVYVGLGAAYFVNDAGDFAGMGAPGEGGWDWTIKPELASPVREVIRIYRNERPARFVALPAVIR